MFRKTFTTLAAVLLTGCIQTAVADFSVHAVFSDREASIIREYYRGHESQSRGRGRGGLKSLPPGIAKNLRRGKPLPPGIAKQVLPAGLIDLLPRVPRGFERVVLGGKILLVEVATQVIHDVLEDAVFH